MSIRIAIDIGSSTTKIVSAEKSAAGLRLTAPAVVVSSSVTDALTGYMSAQNIDRRTVDGIAVTGVGERTVGDALLGLPCRHISEFESIARGGLYLSELDRALVVSIGTGTATVYASKDGKSEYLGGTGVGGGMVVGLSKLLLGTEDVNAVHQLAESGNLNHIDLCVKDILSRDSFPEMPFDITAANFGKVNENASRADIARGIFNLVFETVTMISIFAARTKNTKDIVLTGALTRLPLCRSTFAALGRIFGVNFVFPAHSDFATVIGAALGE